MVQCESKSLDHDQPRLLPPPPPSEKEKSLERKKSDKLYCRLLSKESSLTNPSFRIYYTVSSGSVPFLWESRPGTPKNSVPATALPPLTPPPSYQQHCGGGGEGSGTPSRGRQRQHYSSKAGLLLAAVLPKLHLIRKPAAHAPGDRRPPTLTSSPSVSSSSSSVFSSSVASPSRAVRRRRSRFSSARSSFSSTEVGEEDDDDSDANVDDQSPKSVLCFGMGYGISMASLKNKVLLFGCGSAQRRPAA